MEQISINEIMKLHIQIAVKIFILGCVLGSSCAFSVSQPFKSKI